MLLQVWRVHHREGDQGDAVNMASRMLLLRDVPQGIGGPWFHQEPGASTLPRLQRPGEGSWTREAHVPKVPLHHRRGAVEISYHAPTPAYHAPAPPVYPDEVQPYSFEYGVHDDYTGANFNAGENSDGAGNVEGSYSVALPDGRTQHVTYHADDYNGYVADVTYEGEAHFDEVPYHAPQPAYHAPTPAYHAPAPAYQAPTSQYAPAPTYHHG